jgi:hypothetical protein
MLKTRTGKEMRMMRMRMMLNRYRTNFDLSLLWQLYGILLQSVSAEEPAS